MKTLKEIASEEFKSLDKFFDKDGITMSEANFAANMCKEHAVSIQAEFNELNPYRVQRTFNGKVSNIYGNNLPETGQLDKLGNLYGLSAWLRTAIRIKKSMLSNSFTGMADKYVECVPAFDGICPRQEFVLSSRVSEEPEDILNIKELSKYYRAEAFAAHIGKLIHPGGEVAKYRKSILKPKQPIIYKIGEEVIEEIYSSVTSLEDVDEYFFELQKWYRDGEKTLNMFKGKIRNLGNTAKQKAEAKFREDDLAARNKFKEEMAEYEAKSREHDNKLSQRSSEVNSLALKLQGYVSSLKIVVPEIFADTFESVA